MIAVNRFGFLFFVLALTVVWYLTPRCQRWKVMLAASAVFYLLLDAVGFSVLAAAAWAVWQCALRLKRSAHRKKQWLRLGCICALAPLALKYYGPAAMLLSRITGRPLWDGSGLLIPLGLAYFTLQLAGYLFDVYAEKIEPEQSFARVLCYGTFFLSITQGPFNHYGDLMPQMDATSNFDTQRLWSGSIRMAWGYFKKIAIAERMAIVVDQVFAEPAGYDSSVLLFAACAFSLQLYADFSGYTDIVLGVGEILGLTLPENFRQPYFSKSISEFWDRWHMSLTGWLKEYVFDPLGICFMRGAAKLPRERRKRYKEWSSYIAVLVTFLVSGIWHGTGLQFLVWGLLHGVYQVIGALTRRPRQKIGRQFALPEEHPLRQIWQTVFVFLLVLFGYVFFRAGSLTAAWQYFACIVQNPGFSVLHSHRAMGMGSNRDFAYLLVSILLLFGFDAAHECGLHLRDWLCKRSLWLRWLLYEAAIFGFLLMGHFSGTAGFLYEQF